MATIDPDLIRTLQTRLHKGRAQIYKDIKKISSTQILEPRLAALYLAVDNGINVSRFASGGDWAVLQRSQQPVSQSPTVPPTNAPAKRKPKNNKTKQIRKKRGKNIWVVQGRNSKINRAMEDFLRSIDLKPMEFLKPAKRPSAHIGEILESAFEKAAAVVVLLTPDDLAKLNKKLIKPDDEDYERKLTPQARPNVLFEAGMAFGRNPDNVVIVEVGKLRPFTDISGRHTVRMNNSAAKRKELIQKLRLAGCDADDSGTSWLQTGEFTV
ncbi:MAG TPA: TIR domain-containing protein [Candidatus Angelobacter sp.]